jgi:hypothetical protein
MDHATSAVTPLDVELVQAGDAVGQRAERCGLLQGAVRLVPDRRAPVAPDLGYPLMIAINAAV